ncbi:protein INVOLVED IN DE NOVO 2-like [Spinacia oleracea]|uniref:Protein INVOLVED IN DE NOVO 2-like n=1 Tax=Spinacia oleracea TaxID=3562 RepID=A0ABM3RRB3_SPIOL|nr:protein INVOLVED IN DE NOVO 2-like [Spinacia oleracea]
MDSNVPYVHPYTIVMKNLPIEFIGGKPTSRSLSWLKHELIGLGFRVTKVRGQWDGSGFLGYAFVDFGGRQEHFESAARLARQYELAGHGRTHYLSNMESPTGIYAWLATSTDARLFRGAHLCYQTADIATIAGINAETTMHESIRTYEAVSAGLNKMTTNLRREGNDNDSETLKYFLERYDEVEKGIAEVNKEMATGLKFCEEEKIRLKSIQRNLFTPLHEALHIANRPQLCEFIKQLLDQYDEVEQRVRELNLAIEPIKNTVIDTMPCVVGKYQTLTWYRLAFQRFRQITCLHIPLVGPKLYGSKRFRS